MLKWTEILSPRTHLLRKINLRVVSHFEKCYFIGSNFSWYLWGQDDSSTLQLSFMLISFFKVEIALGIYWMWFIFFPQPTGRFQEGGGCEMWCSASREEMGNEFDIRRDAVETWWWWGDKTKINQDHNSVGHLMVVSVLSKLVMEASWWGWVFSNFNLYTVFANKENVDKVTEASSDLSLQGSKNSVNGLTLELLATGKWAAHVTTLFSPYLPQCCASCQAAHQSPPTYILETEP